MIQLKHVLVATDFGEAADAALTYGRELARTFGATLHVVHVVDDIALRIAVGGTFPDTLVNVAELQRKAEAACRAALDALVTDDDRRSLNAKAVALTSSNASRAILSHANDVHADIIIAGTHGRGGIRRVLLGSVADRVVRLAHCPVLIVRHPEHEFLRPDALERVSHSHE